MKKVDTLCTQWFCPFKHICLRATTKPCKENQKYADFQYKRNWKYGDKPKDICESFVSEYRVKKEEAIQKELKKSGVNKQLEEANMEHYNNFNVTEFLDDFLDLKSDKFLKTDLHYYFIE